MTPQRWLQIKEVFFAARETAEKDRGAYLDSACGDDPELRAEVELLLANDDASSLPRAAVDSNTFAAQFKSGQMLGKYRIEAKLGEGGMGVVYRAYDTRLRRAVALKVVSPGHLADPESRHRLLREARAASALNHPNVVTVHEIGSESGVDFIAMELVEGRTLKETIPAKGLPLGEALSYAVQIAGGLAKAHAAGIVHRDLKPGNIMVTPEGLVKLLDFGLARRVRLGESETTFTAGVGIAGTPAYMSPEQAEGKPLDARSDVFSFGAVLYQMLTGRPAFAGDTGASVLAAVLREEPPPLGRNIPQDLERLVVRCLQKNPARRFQHIDDVRAALQKLKGASDLDPLAAARPHPRWSARAVGLGVAILVSVILVSIALLIVLNIGNWRGRLFNWTGAPRIESVAVLPVKNFSGDPAQEFFADGMTDALIAGLEQIKAIKKVISRTSAMQYKDAKKSLPQIAAELGVAGIVEASVVRSGDKVRITARLIDARRDRDLWASNYERQMADVLVLQSDMVQAIVEQVRAQLTPQESQRLKTGRPVDPEVYDTATKGRAVLEYATREEQLRQSIGLFQRAIDRDPTYAPAWAGLGQALWSLAGTGFEFVAPEDVRGKAIAAADRALELDPNLAEAHNTRALIAIDGEWDLAMAQQHFERALELRPGYAAAHNWYGQMLLLPLNRVAEARRQLEQARELDPLSPWNDINLVAWWNYQGRPERALEEGERARERNPTLWVIPWQMGSAHLFLKQPDQAVPLFKTPLKLLDPDRPAAVLAPLGLAYGLAGRRADAAKILVEMEKASLKRYVSPYYLAIVHSGLGQMDEAFRLLDRALEQRTPFLQGCTPYESTTFAFRRDPRWRSFIERLRPLVRLPPGTPNPYS
jgi:eukaryotic-like serine/threonine-protein kinase